MIAICSSCLKYEIIDLNEKHDCKYISGNRKYWKWRQWHIVSHKYGYHTVRYFKVLNRQFCEYSVFCNYIKMPDKHHLMFDNIVRNLNKMQYINEVYFCGGGCPWPDHGNVTHWVEWGGGVPKVAQWKAVVVGWLCGIVIKPNVVPVKYDFTIIINAVFKTTT